MVGAVLLSAVAGCTAAPDRTLPWWPAPRVATPSPLLDAVGLARPDLRGAGCRRAGAFGPGWRGDLRRFLHGYGTSCLIHVPAARGAPTAAPGVLDAEFDPWGRATYAGFRSPEMHADAARAAADSALAHGLRRPGARRLRCGGQDGAAALRLGLRDEPARGWATPDYQTVLWVSYPVAGRAAVWRLGVTRTWFGQCQA